MSSFGPRLPRMYWGEIIYATPGSGKTYVAGKYADVWDADDLIVEAIDEVSSRYDSSNHDYDDPRKHIGHFFRSINFNKKLRQQVYDKAYRKMLKKTANNDVVLLGTKDLLHIVDRVFIQENDCIVRSGFNKNAEATAIGRLPANVPVHYIEEYLDGSLQKVCQGKL